MNQIPAIFCDIDGVVTKKFGVTIAGYDPKDTRNTPKEVLDTVGANFDRFGAPNENIVRVLETFGRDFTIVFITGRWAMGLEKVENFLDGLLPNVKKKVFCKTHDWPGTTAEFKVAKVRELEAQGYKFYLALDDHSAVTGLLHNHGIFTAHVLSD